MLSDSEKTSLYGKAKIRFENIFIASQRAINVHKLEPLKKKKIPEKNKIIRYQLSFIPVKT